MWVWTKFIHVLGKSLSFRRSLGEEILFEYLKAKTLNFLPFFMVTETSLIKLEIGETNQSCFCFKLITPIIKLIDI